MVRLHHLRRDAAGPLSEAAGGSSWYSSGKGDKSIITAIPSADVTDPRPAVIIRLRPSSSSAKSGAADERKSSSGVHTGGRLSRSTFATLNRKLVASFTSSKQSSPITPASPKARTSSSGGSSRGASSGGGRKVGIMGSSSRRASSRRGSSGSTHSSGGGAAPGSPGPSSPSVRISSSSSSSSSDVECSTPTATAAAKQQRCTGPSHLVPRLGRRVAPAPMAIPSSPTAASRRQGLIAAMRASRTAAAASRLKLKPALPVAGPTTAATAAVEAAAKVIPAEAPSSVQTASSIRSAAAAQTALSPSTPATTQPFAPAERASCSSSSGGASSDAASAFIEIEMDPLAKRLNWKQGQKRHRRTGLTELVWRQLR